MGDDDFFFDKAPLPPYSFRTDVPYDEAAFLGIESGTPPDPDEWWLDDRRMVEPIFVQGDEVPPQMERVTQYRARAYGVTSVPPGEPGYVEATKRMIDRSDGAVVWADRQLGIVEAFGVRGVFLHGFLPWIDRPWERDA